MIAVKYIGKRESYREGTYGSGLMFVQGQTINIEDEDLARKMLRHPDVYVKGDAKEADSAAAKSTKLEKGDEDPAQDARDAIANMNKEALETFAKTHFSVDLDKRKSVGDLRMQVTGLFDQFGTE